MGVSNEKPRTEGETYELADRLRFLPHGEATRTHWVLRNLFETDNGPSAWRLGTDARRRDGLLFDLNHKEQSMKKKEMKIYRQGDVLLKQVREIPADAVVTEKKDQFGNKRVVLAYGEVTGHAHAIHDLENVDIFVKGDGTMYLEIKAETALKHEEHATVLLPPGNYERVVQREYSPEEIRNVMD